MSKFSVVHRQAKTLPYTIDVIGDKQALAFWKEAQKLKAAHREIALEPIRAQRREKAMEYVSDQTVNPYRHKEADRAEIEYRAKRLKQARSDLQRAQDALSDHQATLPADPTSEAPVGASRGLIDKIKCLLKI